LSQESVSGFSYQNIIEYHQLAREAYFEKYQIALGGEAEDVGRASRELIIEIILREPDVIFFIDGSKFPIAIFREIKKILKQLQRKTIATGYVTESPYIDDVIDEYVMFFDVLFTNELNDVKRRDPESRKHIYYLPHSFSPVIHYPGKVGAKYHKDVFFCGTVFPERAEIIANVDWADVDALILGSWYLSQDLYQRTNELYPGKIFDHGLPNGEVAEYYRGSKICVNFDRIYGWDANYKTKPIEKGSAHSIGPRVIEAVACGAFVVSEPRPELIMLFGDSMPTFTNAEELQELIRYYLNHEDERERKAQECLQIVQEMSYENRARYVVQILSQVHDSLTGGT
jgi:spore maturation protein CgeB